MNKQGQREISCIGSAPVGILGVRSISSAWILINWLQERDESCCMNFYQGGFYRLSEGNFLLKQRTSDSVTQAEADTPAKITTTKINKQVHPHRG